MFYLPLLSLPIEEGNLSGIQTSGFMPATLAHHNTVSDLFWGSLKLNSNSLIVPVVLWLLIFMSIWTWGIILSKYRELHKAKADSDKFSAIFWSSRNFAQIFAATANLKSSPVANVYASGHKELQEILTSRDDRQELHSSEFGDIENIERALKRAKAEELTRIEKGTTFLATTASAAPFVGLFGTVWGIMRAFMGLSQASSTSIQAVAPGISEALIATAVGLAAAIPAAMAYNYFMQQVRYLSREMDKFSAEFLNIAKRHFL
ncbi:MAG: MotA/TolQ/ExbB proton channel family protein [Deltaproteobacteria bacterium]|jgi:biopolymer transport protein TolQ|nr:MotA/TolQ/ExbB proton channel family protein [Deltaproteobacteria bacterium]